MIHILPMAYAISITLDVVSAGENFVIKTLACYNFFDYYYVHISFGLGIFPQKHKPTYWGWGGGARVLLCFVFFKSWLELG